MKKYLPVFLIAGIIIAAGVKIYFTPYSPCDTPLTYKMGTLDPKFGLKTSDIISDTKEAEDLIENAYGKNLLEHSPDSGKITINFAYDQRSALDQEISEKESRIEEQNSSLQQKIDQYNANLKIFLQKLTDLNATIKKYNSEGGAPPDVYDGLIARQNQLQIEGDALNARAKKLNLETYNFNSRVDDLNQNITQFNQAITQKPEEGQYDGRNKIITVYFVADKNELIHTIAHEFGHALGMNHVNNPQALMYTYTSKNLEITDEDKAELNAACESYPLPKYWAFLIMSEFYNRTAE